MSVVFLMAALMLLTPEVIAVESSADSTISVSMSDAEIKSEKEFDVKIEITSNPGIWALGLRLSIPDCVTVSKITSGKVLNVESSKSDDGKTISMYGENGSLANVTNTGTYATVTLKAVTTDVALTGTVTCVYQDCINVGGDTVNVDFHGCSISVEPLAHVHNWVDSGKGTEPTCVNTGERILTCTGCSEEKRETIQAKGHTWSDWKTLKEPTETETGLAERTCEACGEKEQKTLPKVECAHDWSDTGKGTDPTCEKYGEKVLVCSKCNEEKREAIPATGHSWSDWKVVKEATLKEEGLQERTCSVCGKTDQKAIPKLECTHEWTDTGKGTEPKCETDGERILVCSKCNEEKHEIIPATGHSWSQWTVVKESTETQDGLEERSCSVCGEVQQKVIPSTGTSSDNTLTYVAIGLAIVVILLIAVVLIRKRSGLM